MAYAYCMKPNNENPQDSSPETPQETHATGETIQLSKNKKLIIIATVTVIILIGGVIAIMMGRSTNTQPSAYNESKLSDDQKKLLSQDNPFAQQYLRDCKQDRKISFTHSPIAVDQLGYIEPMGKMSDGHVTPTDHVYIAPKNPAAADNTTDVVMPADGTVIQVDAMPAQYIGDKNQQTAAEDHRVVIAHNCQYVSIFIHIHKLSDALKTAAGGTIQPNTQKQMNLELKAGDKLGMIGGSPFDWSLMDATKTLSGFITPDLYKSEPWKIHVIDPFSVYSAPLKEQLIAKSLRSTQPYGGKIDYDKKGALIGNWFREGSNGYMGADQQRYWDGHLAIAPHNIDASSTVASLGNWQGKAAQFMVKDSPSPTTTTAASGVVKYELASLSLTANGQEWTGREFAKDIKVRQNNQVMGVALFQVLNGEKLKVELFPGKTAAQVSGFTSAAQTYVR